MKTLLWFVLLMIATSATHGLWATESNETEVEKAAAYLNQLREKVGMVPLKPQPQLAQAAQNHADYLTHNGRIGHLEDQSTPLFTGIKPEDRAAQVGYESRSVTENLSLGQRDATESVDALMSAIYHRFGFLDFYQSELGVGISSGEVGLQYVYDMGNHDLEQFCEYAIYQKERLYYSNACRLQKKVSSQKFDQVRQKILKQNPPVVVWPPEDSDFVGGVFYEENPDPLPDREVSGYPVSIQLNPRYFKEVELISLKLVQVDTELEVKPVRLLTAETDPNRKLEDHQFALFPLERLDWGREYRAEAEFYANGKKMSKKWNFRVKTLQKPWVEIKARGENLAIPAETPYSIYIPPQKDLPFIENLSWKSHRGVRSRIEWEDKNTIRLLVSGDSCGSIFFRLNGKRTFKVYVLNKDYHSSKLSPTLLAETCAAQKSDYDQSMKAATGRNQNLLVSQ